MKFLDERDLALKKDKINRSKREQEGGRGVKRGTMFCRMCGQTLHASESRKQEICGTCSRKGHKVSLKKFPYIKGIDCRTKVYYREGLYCINALHEIENPKHLYTYSPFRITEEQHKQNMEEWNEQQDTTT